MPHASPPRCGEQSGGGSVPSLPTVTQPADVVDEPGSSQALLILLLWDPPFSSSSRLLNIKGFANLNCLALGSKTFEKKWEVVPAELLGGRERLD